MPSEDKPNTETLKQEKEWLIDAKKGLVYYNVKNYVTDGWWKRLDFTMFKSKPKSK